VSVLVLCYIYFLQYCAKRLARKNISKMTYFVSDGTQKLNSMVVLAAILDPESVKYRQYMCL